MTTKRKAIWTYLHEARAPRTARQIAAALDMERELVSDQLRRIRLWCKVKVGGSKKYPTYSVGANAVYRCPGKGGSPKALLALFKSRGLKRRPPKPATALDAFWPESRKPATLLEQPSETP